MKQTEKELWWNRLNTFDKIVLENKYPDVSIDFIYNAERYSFKSEMTKYIHRTGVLVNRIGGWHIIDDVTKIEVEVMEQQQNNFNEIDHSCKKRSYYFVDCGYACILSEESNTEQPTEESLNPKWFDVEKKFEKIIGQTPYICPVTKSTCVNEKCDDINNCGSVLMRTPVPRVMQIDTWKDSKEKYSVYWYNTPEGRELTYIDWLKQNYTLIENNK